MHPNLCLLFYAQNLSGRTHKPVMLVVGEQDHVTQAGEGHFTVYSLVHSEFSNVSALAIQNILMMKTQKMFS